MRHIELMARGRPTKYKKEYCDELIEHMSKGLSYEAFAGAIGVCKQTLYTWEKEHEDFVDAKRRAVEACRIFWEKLGIDHILNETEYQGGSKSLNASVWIFNMKNRFLWRDRQPEEVAQINNYSKLDDDDLDRIIEEKLGRLKKDDEL